MEDATAVANFFLKKSFDEGIPVTPMKLVKLVYISHGWYLGLSDEPLLGERVEAWKYGPVVPSVYYEFRNYGARDITELAHNFSSSGRITYPTVNEENTADFLTRVWEVYKGWNGVQLSAMTHQENTPWYNAWYKDGGKNELSKVIPNDAIAAHYKELAAANIAKTNAAKLAA